MKALTRIFFLLFIFSIFSSLACIATERGEEIVIRKVPEGQVEKYLNDDAFDYARQYEAPVTFWDMVKYWILMSLFRPLSEDGAINFWVIVQWGAMFFACIIIVFYLIKSGKLSLFAKDSKAVRLNITDQGENIHELDFDELLSDSVKKGEYRMAVRYHYLKSLKVLSDKNLISWKAEKTNRDYNKELKTTELAPIFKEITFLFDYSWYGNPDLSDGAYQSIKSSFERFNQAITTGK